MLAVNLRFLVVLTGRMPVAFISSHVSYIEGISAARIEIFNLQYPSRNHYY